MSQHSQRAQRGPSTEKIVQACAGVGASYAALTTLVVVGGEVTVQYVTGLACALALSVVASHYAWNLQAEREAVKTRIQLERERAARQAEQAETARINTIATWSGEHPGLNLSVRYDRATERLMVKGWMGDHFQVPRETAWYNLTSLAEAITEMEATTELEPVASPGMELVRQRLGLLTSPAALRAVNVPVLRGEPVTEQMPRVQ